METKTKDKVSEVNHSVKPFSGVIQRAIGPVNAHNMVKHKPNSTTAMMPSFTDASCQRLVNPYNAPTRWQ